MTAHSVLGPSGAHRWMRCPGSVAAEQAAPPEPDSEYASEGSTAHAVAETVLRGPENYRPHDLVGKVVGDHTVTDEMAHHVDLYTQWVRRHSRKHDLFVESRVRYDNWVPGGFGTLDAGIIKNQKHAVIVDLKFGRGVAVHPEENEQHLLYALGFYQETAPLYDLETFEAVIYQPRINPEPQTWQFDLEYLMAFAEHARVAAEATADPNAPRIPGEKQCRFCKARAVCREYADWQLAKIDAELDFDDPDPILLTPASMLTPEQIGRIYVHLDNVSNWIKAVKDHVSQAPDSDLKKMGLKLVKGGRRQRYWLDEKKVEEMLKGYKLGLDKIYSMKLIGPAGAEKVLGPRRWKAVEPLIGWTEGKNVVVPIDDPRPSATDVDDEFDFV